MNLARYLLVTACLSMSIGSVACGQTPLSTQLKAEGTATLAKAAREQGDAVRGAILFPQQNLGCANCHAIGQKNMLGPDLSQLGEQATDEYLVEAILEPAKTIKKGYESVSLITTQGKVLSGRVVEQTPKSTLLRVREEGKTNSGGTLVELAADQIQQIKQQQTSAMPNNLVDQLADRQQFLDLVRYMIELAEAGATAGQRPLAQAGTGELADELRGHLLLDKFQCTACHAGDALPAVIPAKQAPLLAQSASMLNPQWVKLYLEDPQHVKPGTTMPQVMAHMNEPVREQVATALTHYLTTLGDSKFSVQTTDAKAGQRGEVLFHSIGCVACHSPRDDNHHELLQQESVPLGNISGKYNLVGLASFLEKPHAVRPSGRMPNMKLSHFETLDLANYLLLQTDPAEAAIKTWEFDQSLAEQGRQQFEQLGCIACHQQSKPVEARAYKALADVDTSRGCLSGEQGNWPEYQLPESDRQAIIAAIDQPTPEFTAQQTIDLTLATFNCTACHRRGDLGGITAERDQYFHTTNPNLGPQGRIPPTLTGVGAKLKPKWMRQVLVSGRSIRPYMPTRMPQYGVENIEHLIDLLQSTDELPPVETAEFSDEKELRNISTQLVGSGGLNCIACHTFQHKPAQTMPAVDLTEMGARLQERWFHRYMLNPQRFNPGTVMPSFWPGGRALRAELLDGDPTRQVSAIWNYLLEGRQARTPRGLVTEPIELLATDEAVMLRRSYPNIGKRGIGVGYVEQVNLAYDAQQMRLAMIWKGRFADPGGVWRNQGSGRVRPLGTDLLLFVGGPELDDRDNPWQVDQGRPPEHRFGGYYLDGQRRPTFMYRFRDIEVEDYPVDVTGDEETGNYLRRTLTFSARQTHTDVAFRVASGKNIAADGEKQFLIDDKLRVRIVTPHKAEISEVDDGKQLRIPLEITTNASKLILEYHW